jgi:HEAT repeat protein
MFLGVIGTTEDLKIIRSAVREPPLARAAVMALGALGDSAGVPVLLEAMASAELLEHAAAAFVRITGVTHLHSSRPVRATTPDEQDDEGPSVDPARASSAWEKVKGAFTPSRRWQQGKDVASIGLAAAMATLSLQTRRDLYHGARPNRDSTASDVELEGTARRRTNKAPDRSSGSRP